MERTTFDAAIELLERDGVSSVTMDLIARHAGISKISLYRRWPSKMALLLDATFDYFEKQAPFDENGSPVHAIATQLVTMSAIMRGRAGRLLRNIVAECTLNDEESGSLIRDRYLGLRRKTAIDLIERGLVARLFRATGSAEVLHDLLYGAMFYRLLFGFGRIFDAESILELFETALAPEPGWRDGWMATGKKKRPASGRVVPVGPS